MNKEQLLILADVLERPHQIEKPRFYMGSWGFEGGSDSNLCDTAACIAGHAVWLFQTDIWNDPRERLHIPQYAQETLGLTNQQADALFTPNCDDVFGGSGISFTDFNAQAAAEAVRNMAFTGVPDWVSAVKAHQPDLLENLDPFKDLVDDDYFEDNEDTSDCAAS